MGWGVSPYIWEARIRAVGAVSSAGRPEYGLMAHRLDSGPHLLSSRLSQR
jgi:hypothetical protein